MMQAQTHAEPAGPPAGGSNQEEEEEEEVVNANGHDAWGAPHAQDVVEELMAMFPRVEREVICAVLEQHNNQVGRAIDSLLHLGDHEQAEQGSGGVYVGVPQRGGTAVGDHGRGSETRLTEAPRGGTGSAGAQQPPVGSSARSSSGSSSHQSAPVVASSAHGPVSLLPPRSSAAAAAAQSAALSWQSHAVHSIDNERGGGGAVHLASVFANGGGANGFELAGNNVLSWMAALLGPPDGRGAPRSSSSSGSGASGFIPPAGLGPFGGGAGDSPLSSGDAWAWAQQWQSPEVWSPQPPLALVLGTRLWDAVAAQEPHFPHGVLSLFAAMGGRCHGVLALLHQLLGRFRAQGSAALLAGGAGVSVPQRLEAWRIQLAAMCGVLVAEMMALGGPFASAAWHGPHRESLQLCVEGLVLSGVHDTLMPAVTRLCERADDAMNDVLARLARVPPQLLGVPRQWAHIATDAEATRRLRALPGATCPSIKVACIRDTLRRLADAVSAVNQAEAEESAAAAASSSSESHHSLGGLPLAADDMLSIMVVLLARSRVRCLVAEAVYCDTFLCMTEATSHKGELGFALTTFMAACEYVRSKDVARLCTEWEENGRVWEAQLLDGVGSAGAGGQQLQSPSLAVPSPIHTDARPGSASQSDGTPATSTSAREVDPLGVLSGVVNLADRARPSAVRAGTPSSPMSVARTPTESLEGASWLLQPTPESASSGQGPTPTHGSLLETSWTATDEDPLSGVSHKLHDIALD